MGRMNAESMAEMIDNGVTLRQALSWHLTSNHYPALPVSLIDPCLEAIQATDEDDWDRMIDLPDPILYRGEPQAPAWAIVEAHHLEAFLSSDDYED